MKEEQIIKAARELFTKYGFKKVSMDEIANKAGVTKKTVYTYFSSKEELLNYFIKEELKNMRLIIEETESKNTDFFEGIHEALCNLLKYKNKSNFLQVIFEESEMVKNGGLKENLKIIDKQIKDYIKERLEIAEKQKYIKVQNIDIMTFLIYKMYIALMIDWNKDYEQLNEEEIADNLLEILKSGLKRKEVE